LHLDDLLYFFVEFRDTNQASIFSKTEIINWPNRPYFSKKNTPTEFFHRDVLFFLGFESLRYLQSCNCKFTAEIFPFLDIVS
jgi:hypothetical protein